MRLYLCTFEKPKSIRNDRKPVSGCLVMGWEGGVTAGHRETFGSPGTFGIFIVENVSRVCTC